jgi:3-dehydroquinate synthase
MTRTTLAHPDGTSQLLIGEGLLGQVGEELRPWLEGRLLFVLSSPGVRALHDAALDPLRGLAARVVELEVPDGEAAKGLEHAGRLWREMLAAGGKRDSRLMAFGGGSIGDLGGFVAGCFMRGIELVQVPTTLLAQVDASVGGRTAIDLPEAKNSVGVFHHPAWVLADTALLATLPTAELRSGLVEVMKMGFLLDPLLFARVESELERLLAGEGAALVPVVAASIAAKARVVEIDPEERDARRLLNFGHTLGHALETTLSYATLRHGEAVGYGLLFALRLAERRGLEAEVAGQLRRLIARLELPPLPPLDVDTLLTAMGRDKKATESGLVWVLPAALGEGRMVRAVGGEEVRAELSSFLRAPFEPADRDLRL